MGTVISASGLRQSHFKAWCWVGFNLGSYPPPHTHTPDFHPLKGQGLFKGHGLCKVFWHSNPWP